MDFNQLVDYVKKDGCVVRLYNRSELKCAQCTGTFDISKRGNPVISIAIRGHTKSELRSLLLHEYAHFLQWRDGLLEVIEGPGFKEGWDHLDEWLKGKKRSKAQLIYGRNSALYIEYDAEIRTLELSSKLNVDIGSHKEYIKDANSYMLLIKWCALNRKWDDRPAHDDINENIMTLEELLLPLTDREKEILEEAL